MANKVKEVDDWQALPASGGADDWQELPAANPSAQRAMAAKHSNKSIGESGAAGITQGVTFGYTPQIVANLANLGGNIQDLIRGPVINPATGKPIDRVSYVDARDATAKDLTEARDSNPKTYFAGNVAGVLGTPTGALLKGAGTLAKSANLARTAGVLEKLGGPVKTAWGAAGRGALYGGLSNPGEDKGEISPFQPGARAVNATLGAGLGAVAQGWSNAASDATRGYRASKELVQNELGPSLQREVREATDGMQMKYLDPLKQKAREAMSGKDAQVDPSFLNGQEMPGLQQALTKRTPGYQKQQAAQSMLGAAEPPAPGDNMATISAAAADRIRARLDREARIKQRSSIASPTVAKSAEDACSAANKFRDARNQAAPDAVPVFDELHQGLGLKSEIANKADTDPLGVLTQPPGKIPYTTLGRLDEKAGTNLQQRGADLRRGQWLLGQENSPSGGTMPSKTGIFGMAARHGVGVASKYGAVPADAINRGIGAATGGRGISEAFIRDLIEQIARGK